jgi:hypothetical protein
LAFPRGRSSSPEFATEKSEISSFDPVRFLALGKTGCDRLLVNLEFDACIEKAEPAIQIVKEMKWNTGGSKKNPPASKEKCVQFAVQDQYAEEYKHRDGEELDPEHCEGGTCTGQSDQCNAQSLAPFEVQIVGSVLVLEDEA